MTEKELKIFKDVLIRNGIPCRKVPRTKEEMANLKCVYNEKTDTIAIKPKDYVLLEGEIYIATEGLCKDCAVPDVNRNVSNTKNSNEDCLTT